MLQGRCGRGNSMMGFLQRIVTFLEKLVPGNFLVNDRSPVSIAQKALKKWHEPTNTIARLLLVKKPSLPVLYAACIIWGNISANRPEERILLLRDILQRLPAPARVDALMHACGND